jgi:hypothetical protein
MGGGGLKIEDSRFKIQNSKFKITGDALIFNI